MTNQREPTIETNIKVKRKKRRGKQKKRKKHKKKEEKEKQDLSLKPASAFELRLEIISVLSSEHYIIELLNFTVMIVMHNFTLVLFSLSFIESRSFVPLP